MKRHSPPRIVHPLIFFWIVMSAGILWSAAALAQPQQPDKHSIGSLSLEGTYWSAPNSNASGLMVQGLAMAVDRVPNSVVGRFGELRIAGGAGLNSDLLPYKFHFKLGVGLGTDFFVMFLASGILVDGYDATSDEGEAQEVPFGVGVPMTLGFWLTPFDSLYLYAMAEPAWYSRLESREPPKITPIDFGDEMRSRVGLAIKVGDVHLRFEYTHHQVLPGNIHSFSLGIGAEPTDLTPY